MCDFKPRLRLLTITVAFYLLLAVFSYENELLADTLYVPLPGLIGSYSTATTRTDSFNLEVQLESVNSVSIYWRGTITPGVGQGDGVEMPIGDPFDWPTQIEALMNPVGNGIWAAWGGSFNGPFEETSVFDDFWHPSWEFILDGQGAVSVSLAPLIFIGGSMLTPPYGVVDSAVLIVDAVIDAATDVETEVTESLPRFELSQNRPNPFNPRTEIGFALPSASSVRLTVYNILGQQVSTIVDTYVEAGEHSFTWDGSGMASGVYLYRLQAGEFIETRKMVLMK